MTNRSLRDFCHEVKRLIDMGSYAQAIETGRHILRHYPKHVETYALLGQACLEKGDIREAVEMFQRALSADPEHVTAWVGLAAACEHDDLPAMTAWHLERAFELDPARAGVREELQKLYAQLHHIKELRLKLNPAALGRLYLRGGLYQQAAAEFRATLEKEPMLAHVRVGLATALWRLGQRVEAADVCLDILRDLPHCLQANLILGEIWLRSDRQAEGEMLLRIAEALDPENRKAQEIFGHQSPLEPKEPALPPLGVMPAAPPESLPRPSIEAGAAPGLIPVISPTREEAPARPPEEAEMAGLPEMAEEELPEWLQEAQRGAAPPPAGAEIEELAEEPLPEERAEEMPAETAPEAEWLAELEEQPEEELPPWLQELMEGTTPAAEAPAEETPAPAEAPEAEAFPAAPTEEMKAAGEEIPDWLGELAEPAPEVQEEPEVSDLHALAAELPDDLRALVEETLEMERAAPVEEDLEAPPEEAPAEEPETEGPAMEAEPPEMEAEPPDWLLALAREEERPEALEAQPEPAAEAGEEAEAVPDWLRALAEEEGAAGQEAPAEAEAEPSIPAWLTRPAPEEPAGERAEGQAAKDTAEEAIPDWLENLRRTAIEHIPAIEEELAAPAAEAELQPEEPEAALPWEEEAEAATEVELESALMEPEPAALEEAAPEQPEPEAGAEIEAPEAPPEEAEEPEETVEEQEAAFAVSESMLEELVFTSMEMEGEPAIERDVTIIDEFEGEAAAEIDIGEEEIAGPAAEAPEAEEEAEALEPARAGLEAPTPFIGQALERLEMRPDDHEMRLALARAWKDENRFERAEEHDELLIQADQYLESIVRDLEAAVSEPESAQQAWILLGDAYMKQGRLSDAMQAYRKALGR